MNNVKKIHTAVWLYADMTRGFMTGMTTPAEHLELVEKAKRVKLRIPEVEAQVDTVEGALLRWHEDSTPDQRELGVDEDTLHEYFGMNWDRRGLSAVDMADHLDTVTRADLGLPEPEGIEQHDYRVSEGLAQELGTLCQAARELLAANVSRYTATSPKAGAEIRAAIEALHEAACAHPPGEIMVLPPALMPTVRRLLSFAPIGEFIASRLGGLEK